MTNAEQRNPGEANPIVQLAILVGIFVLVANAGFYFLSEVYFDDRVTRFGAEELARLSGARVEFAIFTIVLGGASILAAMYPRAVAHGVPALAGLLSLCAALFAFSLGLVLPLTLLVVSGVFGLLVWLSLHRSRAGWSCLVALCAVYGIVMLFGAPKVRGLVGVGMWIALIVPGLLGVGTAALHKIRGDYGDAT